MHCCSFFVCQKGNKNLILAPFFLVLHNLLIFLCYFCFLNCMFILVASHFVIFSAGVAISTNYQIIRKVPHDQNCFTQGIVFLNESTYIQSCGLYGRSSLNIVDLYSGKKIKSVKSNRKYFFEGVTIFENTLIVLTWKEHTILKFSLNLEYLSKYDNYPYEGWGITSDEKKNVLYTTDGSNRIHILNARNYTEIDFIDVFCFGKDVGTRHLNELEIIAPDYIFANVWLSNYIVRINLKRKTCDSFFSFNEYDPRGDVLNGIGLIPTYNLKLNDMNYNRLESMNHSRINEVNSIGFENNSNENKNNNNELLFLTGKLWRFGYIIYIV